MASISKQSNGRKTVQFVAPDGKRKSIRLGKCSQRAAEAVKRKVEHLASHLNKKHALDAETARWVAEIPDDLRDKLTAVGLVNYRETATIGEFMQDFIDGRKDVKPATRVVWRQVKKCLEECFAPDRVLRTITRKDAEDFRPFLVGKELRDTTIHKRLVFTRQFFKAMKRMELVEINPFEDVKHAAGDASEKQRFIPREDVTKLIETAPNVTWRTIIALSRFGGLRCPSEVLSLKWDGVDWEKGRIRVDSPKTAHHAGKASRTIPLFPELRPFLEEAWDAAPEGAVYVIGGNYRNAAQQKNGWNNALGSDTAYDIMKIPRVRGKRREVRRILAERSRRLLEKYRAGSAADPTCPLKQALLAADSDTSRSSNDAPIL